MAFFGPLLGAALPFLGRALQGAVGGVAKAVQRGGSIGDVLKGGALGALSGAVGQPDETPMVEPKEVYDAPVHKPSNPRTVPQRKIKIPQMMFGRKKKSKSRR